MDGFDDLWYFLYTMPTKEEFKSLIEAQLEPELTGVFTLAVVTTLVLSIFKR